MGDRLPESDSVLPRPKFAVSRRISAEGLLLQQNSCSERSKFQMVLLDSLLWCLDDCIVAIRQLDLAAIRITAMPGAISAPTLSRLYKQFGSNLFEIGSNLLLTELFSSYQTLKNKMQLSQGDPGSVLWDHGLSMEQFGPFLRGNCSDSSCFQFRFGAWPVFMSQGKFLRVRRGCQASQRKG